MGLTKQFATSYVCNKTSLGKLVFPIVQVVKNIVLPAGCSGTIMKVDKCTKCPSMNPKMCKTCGGAGWSGKIKSDHDGKTIVSVPDRKKHVPNLKRSAPAVAVASETQRLSSLPGIA